MLDEIARAHRVLADRPRPDLGLALRLAHHRWECTSADHRKAWSGGEDANEALDELMAALHQIGDEDAVARVADLFMQAAARVDHDTDSGSWELVMIVQSLAGVGQVDRAEQLIAAVPDVRTQGEAQSLLARLLVLKGDVPRAERTVAVIVEADLRSTAWLELVPWMSGDPARGLREAEESIALTDPGDQPGKLNHLAQTLLPGHADQARRVAARAADIALTLTDPHDRDWGRMAAVAALALTGQVERAEQIIPTIVDRSPRELAMFKLVVVLGETGDFDRGLRVADGITDADTRSNAQRHLVGPMAETGNTQWATATASAITSPSDRAKGLADLAGALVEAGDVAGSRPVVEDAERANVAIEHPATRRLSRQHLVRTLIEAGDFEQAELTAVAAVEGRDPDFDLNRLAEGMIAAGHPDGARRVIDLAASFAAAITEPSSRAWSLTSVAANYFAVGAVDEAVRVLIEASGGGPWYRTLAKAAIIDPDAVHAVAEDVLHRETSNRD